MVAVAPQDVDSALALAEQIGLPAREIGVVAGETLKVRGVGLGMRLDVQHLKTVWREALPRALDG